MKFYKPILLLGILSISCAAEAELQGKDLIIPMCDDDIQYKISQSELILVEFMNEGCTSCKAF